MRGDDDDALRRGEAALRAGRVAEAEAEFRAHADDNERDPRSRVYLARIYREAGRYPDADREIQAGLRAASADRGAADGARIPAAGPGARAGRGPGLPQAVLADSASRRAWAGLVRSLRASGRPAEAERVLRRAPADLRAMMRTADAQAVDSAGAAAPGATTPAAGGAGGALRFPVGNGCPPASE